MKSIASSTIVHCAKWTQQWCCPTTSGACLRSVWHTWYITVQHYDHSAALECTIVQHYKMTMPMVFPCCNGIGLQSASGDVVTTSFDSYLCVCLYYTYTLLTDLLPRLARRAQHHTIPSFIIQKRSIEMPIHTYIHVHIVYTFIHSWLIFSRRALIDWNTT